MEKRGFLKMSVFSLSLSLSLMWAYQIEEREEKTILMSGRKKEEMETGASERASQDERSKEEISFHPVIFSIMSSLSFLSCPMSAATRPVALPPRVRMR